MEVNSNVWEVLSPGQKNLIHEATTHGEDALQEEEKKKKKKK